MIDTEIENTIKKYILLKKNLTNEENSKDIQYYKNLLLKYMENFYYFSKRIVSSKNNIIENLISKILEQIEFIIYRKDSNIWNIGDTIENIYIIFIGEVNIYKVPEKKDKKLYMELDTVLGKGYLLGVEYLRYNNEDKRTYLAKAKSKCILGKINLKEFLKIYKPIISEENILISNFLRDINIFSSDFNGKFQKALTLKYYKKDDYIFKQGDLFDSFYLVYHGDIRLYTNMKKIVKSKFDYDILKGNNNKERFTTSRLFEIKGSYNELIRYDLLDAGRGDFIGGIEYMYNYCQYGYNAKCLNDVSILKIDCNLFNTILINKEKKNFKEKIDKQKEFIKKRMKEIKLGREKIKLNDYILSKNKYVKSFLQSYPLSKKMEEKLDLYINCNVEPIKIKYKTNNIKILNTSKNLLPKYIEEYKASKKNKKNWKKNNLTIKDFLTNIDYKNQTNVAKIFPCFLSEENIPKSHNVIYKIKEENKKVDKMTNTEEHFFEQKHVKKFRSFSNINFGKKSEVKKNKKIFLNNKSLNKHLFLDLRTKFNMKEFAIKRKSRKNNTFKK